MGRQVRYKVRSGFVHVWEMCCLGGHNTYRIRCPSTRGAISWNGDVGRRVAHLSAPTHMCKGGSSCFVPFVGLVLRMPSAFARAKLGLRYQAIQPRYHEPFCVQVHPPSLGIVLRVGPRTILSQQELMQQTQRCACAECSKKQALELRAESSLC